MSNDGKDTIEELKKKFTAIAPYIINDPAVVKVTPSLLPGLDDVQRLFSGKVEFLVPMFNDGDGESRHLMYEMGFNDRRFAGFKEAVWCHQHPERMEASWPQGIVTKKALLFDGSIVRLPRSDGGTAVDCVPSLIRNWRSGVWGLFALPLVMAGPRFGKMIVTVAVGP